MFDKFLKSSNWKFKQSCIEFTDLEKPDIFLMLSCPIQEKNLSPYQKNFLCSFQ